MISPESSIRASDWNNSLDYAALRFLTSRFLSGTQSHNNRFTKPYRTPMKDLNVRILSDEAPQLEKYRKLTAKVFVAVFFT